MALSGAMLLVSARALDTAVTAVAHRSSVLPTARADRATGTSVPAAVLVAPALTAPGNPYTNQAQVTLHGILPAGALHGSDLVRIYRQSEPGVVVAEVRAGALPEFSVPNVPLVPGLNAFTATLAGAAGETAPSAPVRYVYLATRPRIVILAPAAGATLGSTTVAVSGRVPAGSSIVVRNLTNSTGSTTKADPKGSFVLVVTLDRGTNTLLITATDLAGSQASAPLTVVRTAARGH